jgi:retron-type reverse transcriptase
VRAFNDKLAENLSQLRQELRQKTYQPGDYYSFRIFDPKPRLISAAPYRDRVVHHALCNIIVPQIEKTFIHHSYANRKGFGTHRALKQFTYLARSNRYILQCDLKKYFPSIDHQILKQQIRRKLKCRDTLWLIEKIIDNSNEQEPVIEYFQGDSLLTPLLRRKGLPIGNLTSQFFANWMLDSFDHFVAEKLKVSGYLRYVDDFALFADDYHQLKEARKRIEDYLSDLRLTLHPHKTQLFETRYGGNFVGFRVLPETIRVRNDNLRRGRQRLKQIQQDYRQGKLSLKKLIQRLQSWEAHLKHGNTYHLRQKIFEHCSFARSD